MFSSSLTRRPRLPPCWAVALQWGVSPALAADPVGQPTSMATAVDEVWKPPALSLSL